MLLFRIASQGCSDLVGGVHAETPTSIIVLTSAYQALVPAAASPGTIAFLVTNTLNFGGLLLVPASIGVAILRANLLDIDVIINHALVYGALTGTLALVYLALVVGLGGAIRALTAGGGQN